MFLINSIIKVYNFLYNTFLLKNYRVKYGKKLLINGRIYIRNKGEIIFGNNVKINSALKYNPIGCEIDTRMVVYKDGIIEIGDNVGISNSIFISQSRIQIGNDVLIGNGCKIWDTDFHPINIEKRKLKNNSGIRTCPVIIRNNAFIGGCSIILKGVTIGENSVIGAGSVVTKNIPENQIWAGNPARYIKDIK